MATTDDTPDEVEQYALAVETDLDDVNVKQNHVRLKRENDEYKLYDHNSGYTFTFRDVERVHGNWKFRCERGGRHTTITADVDYPPMIGHILRRISSFTDTQ
jgi:hypothetical protein